MSHEHGGGGSGIPIVESNAFFSGLGRLLSYTGSAASSQLIKMWAGSHELDSEMRRQADAVPSSSDRHAH